MEGVLDIGATVGARFGRLEGRVGNDGAVVNLDRCTWLRQFISSGRQSTADAHDADEDHDDDDLVVSEPEERHAARSSPSETVAWW